MKAPKATELSKNPAPYVSFVTFRNLLDHLGEAGTPSRIERTVMGSMMNGSIYSALMSALKYLKLVDDQGNTLPPLERLAEATGDEREKLLRDLLESSYPFLFDPKERFNLPKATKNQLLDKFVEQNPTREVAKKSVAFFLNAANFAGIQVSPFIRPPRQHIVRNRPSRGKIERKGKRTGDNGDKESDTTADENETSTEPQTFEQRQLEKLLAKFPDFDPTWENEMKSEWFKQYFALLGSVGLKRGDEQKGEEGGEVKP